MIGFVCIFFQGENDIEQLCCVLRVLGTPNEKIWPGMSDLPDYNKITFPENPPIPFEDIVPDATEDAIDLLKKFLVYPSKEVSLTSILYGPTVYVTQ